MSDATQHVGAGQPVAIPAAVWNDVLDVVQWFRRQRGTAPGAGAASGANKRAASQVLVKNGIGSSLGAFSVVALGAPLTAAASDPHDVYEHPVFPGTAPAAATDPFAILRDPLGATPENLFGWAVVQGPCVAYVSVTDAAHKYAIPAIGVTAALASATTGPARILSTVTGTGTQLVEVLLLGDAPGTSGGGGSSATATAITVRAATTVPLPTNTYSNGASGVGATWTGAGNGALASVDGVTLSLGQSVLIQHETPATQRGPATLTQVGDGSSPFILTRHTDADTPAKLLGLTVKVTEGDTHRDTLWQCAANETITVGGDALYFELIGRRGHPAELTSTWDVTYGYDWKRLAQSDVALTDASPSVTGRYARTARGNTGLAIGTKGWLEPAHAPGDRGWIFIPDSLTGATGSLGSATGLPLSTGVTGVLPSANGGTGVNNGAYQQTLGGSLTTAGAVTVAGAFALTATLTGTTSVTLPTSGTLLSTTSTGTAFARWVLWGTLTHANFTAASPGEAVYLGSVPAKTTILGGAVHTRVAADDPVSCSVWFTLRRADAVTDTGTQVDGLQVDSLSNFRTSGPQIPMWFWDQGVEVGVELACNSDVADLTTGEWDVYVLVATIP